MKVVGRLAGFVAVLLGVLCLCGCCLCHKQVVSEPAPKQEAQPSVPAPQPELPPVEVQAPPKQEPVTPAEPPEVAPAPAEPITFHDIFFDTNKFNLKPESRDILDKIAAKMLENPKLSLAIEAYCDERGSIKYNMALGERRAKAAVDYLIKKGVEPHRIISMSHGEGGSLDTLHTENAWAKNRRVRFIIK